MKPKVKTNKCCRFTISFVLFTLFQKLVQKTVKKGTSNMKVIPLNCRLSGHPEIFKVKLYYFQERLSLRYNTESCFLKQPNQNAQMK